MPALVLWQEAFFLSASTDVCMLFIWLRVPFLFDFIFRISFWHISLTVSSYVLPSSLANIPLTPETARDQERRIRREIANSNERRRMQSINAGFQSLKTLIPHSDGEKLSKVGLAEF